MKDKDLEIGSEYTHTGHFRVPTMCIRPLVLVFSRVYMKRLYSMNYSYKVLMSKVRCL